MTRTELEQFIMSLIFPNANHEVTATAFRQVFSKVIDYILEKYGDIGSLDQLTTTQKSDIVAAVNELVGKLATIGSKVGDLTKLATSEKNNLVSAMNEIVSKINSIQATINSGGSSSGGSSSGGSSSGGSSSGGSSSGGSSSGGSSSGGSSSGGSSSGGSSSGEGTGDSSGSASSGGSIVDSNNIASSRTLGVSDALYSVEGYAIAGDGKIYNDANRNGDSKNASLPATDMTVMVFPLYKGDKTVTLKQMYTGINASNVFQTAFAGFNEENISSSPFTNSWRKALYADVWNQAKIGNIETNTYDVPTGALYVITWWKTSDLSNFGGITITHEPLASGELECLPTQGRMTQSYSIDTPNTFPYATTNDAELTQAKGCLYYYKFPVIAGTSFKVNIGTRKKSSSLKWSDAWVDSNMNFVASVEDLTNVSDKVLTPPSGAAYLILNSLGTDDSVFRVTTTSSSGGSSTGGSSTDTTQTLLTMADFVDSTDIATSTTDMSSAISNAQSQINAIDPTHKFLRVAVVSDLHSVPNDTDSQAITLYPNMSCTDNIVLFGKCMSDLNCDAGFALGDYSDNRIAFSDKITEVSGGVAKYKTATKSVINKLRNSHAKPMFFTMGNHDYGDSVKGQIYTADDCNRIIQTCNRPGSNSVKYLNGNGFAYSVKFPSYNVKIAVDSDGAGISGSWDMANEIYKQTPANWTVGLMWHGSTTDAITNRHDGTFSNGYTFSGNNLKSFGIIRGHVHGSGQVGFSNVSVSGNGHSLTCPRLSVPASFYTNGTESSSDHFCITIFVFDTDNNKTHAIRLGRQEWEIYVESSAPTFPYSYNFVANDL